MVKISVEERYDEVCVKWYRRTCWYHIHPVADVSTDHGSSAPSSSLLSMMGSLVTSPIVDRIIACPYLRGYGRSISSDNGDKINLWSGNTYQAVLHVDGMYHDSRMYFALATVSRCYVTAM